MYKNLIDSYQSEVTVNISATASSRIQQLEDILESYRKQMETMETEMSKAQTNLNTSVINATVSRGLLTMIPNFCFVLTIVKIRNFNFNNILIVASLQRSFPVSRKEWSMPHLTTKVIHFYFNLSRNYFQCLRDRRLILHVPVIACFFWSVPKLCIWQ